MVGQSALIGRSDEIEAVTRVITGGHGVTVSGPAGIGKTSLVRRVVSDLSDAPNHERPRFALVEVSATEASQPIPLGALAGHLVGAPPGADDLARVQEALLGRAEGRPLLVVVDDGHLLDDFSAVAIHQLSASGHARVLATVRDDELASSAFDALIGTGLSQRFLLPPLNHAAVAAMVADQLGGAVDARLVQEAWAASRGVPMVVSLLVESGVRDGAIVQHHGLWTVTGTLTAEPQLVTLISGQLDRLVPAERSAVEALALSEPLEAAIVDRLVPPQVLTRLRRKGLVVGVDGDAGTALRLVHPLFGEAARRDVTDERRRAIIVSFARALDLSDSADADTLLRVAMWGAAAECQLEPGLMVRAADVVRTRSINSAIHLLQAAVAAGAPPPVLLELVRSLVVAGRVDEAEAVLVEFDPAGLTPTERVLACVTRAVGLTWTLHLPDSALGVLAQERATTGGDPVLSAIFDAAESGALLMRGDLEAAWRAGTRALATPAIGDESLVLAATVTALALAYQGRSGPALEVAREWDRAAGRVRANGPHLHAGLRATRWEVLVETGELATLVDECEVVFADAVARHDEFMRSRAAHYLGRAALLAARPRRAQRYLREALVALDEFDRMFVAWNLALLAEAQALGGDTVQARETLAESDQQGPLAAIFSYSRARAEAAILAAEGRMGEAAVCAEAGARAAGDHGLLIHALWCWYDAARFGDAGATSELGLLARVDGGLAVACREHASALALGRGDELDRVAASFAAIGATLHAAEAGMEAAAAHQRAGRRTRASASFELARSFLDPTDPVATPILQSTPGAVASLTPREREVARLASRGMSDRAIAEQLGVSVRTVESHLARAYAKLGLPGRTALTSVFMTAPTG